MIDRFFFLFENRRMKRKTYQFSPLEILTRNSSFLVQNALFLTCEFCTQPYDKFFASSLILKVISANKKFVCQVHFINPSPPESDNKESWPINQFRPVFKLRLKWRFKKFGHWVIFQIGKNTVHLDEINRNRSDGFIDSYRSILLEIR